MQTVQKNSYYPSLAHIPQMRYQKTIETSIATVQTISTTSDVYSKDPPLYIKIAEISYFPTYTFGKKNILPRKSFFPGTAILWDTVYAKHLSLRYILVIVTSYV